MAPTIDFRDISHSYRENAPVLNGASFSVASGEVVGLLGRNGSGKTTLIRLAMGLLRPKQGTVRLFGLNPVEDPVPVKSRIGYVAEDQLLPKTATPNEMFRLYQSLYPKWDKGLERDLADRFQLSRAQSIHSMSKGQARQVALICAIAHRPELLILVEPAGGLDPAARRELLEASMQALHREGSAILFSSHHMADVERLGGRVVLLEDGRVRLDDQLAGLRDAVCVAVVNQHGTPDSGVIERSPGCLRVRPVDGYWHAVFRGTPESVGPELKRVTGGDVECSRVDLEELFVELLGGKR